MNKERTDKPSVPEPRLAPQHGPAVLFEAKDLTITQSFPHTVTEKVDETDTTRAARVHMVGDNLLHTRMVVRQLVTMSREDASGQPLDREPLPVTFRSLETDPVANVWAILPDGMEWSHRGIVTAVATNVRQVRAQVQMPEQPSTQS
jgi:hypothetical protein